MLYEGERKRKQIIGPALMALALPFIVPISASAQMFINGQISGGFGYLPAAVPYCPYPMSVAPGSQHPKDKVDHLKDRYKDLENQLKSKERARRNIQNEQDQLLTDLENHFNAPFGGLISEHVVHEGNCCEFTNAEQGYADSRSWRKSLGALASIIENPRPSRGIAAFEEGSGGYSPSWHYTSSGLLANFSNRQIYNCESIARLSARQLTPDRFGWYYFMGNCPQREIGKYQGLPQPMGTPPPPEQLEAHRARCFNVLTDSRGAWNEDGLATYKNAVNGGSGRMMAQAGFVEYYFSQCPQILNSSRIVVINGRYQIVPQESTTAGQTVVDFVRERDFEFARQRFLAQGLDPEEARARASIYADQYGGNTLIGPGTPDRHRQDTAGAQNTGTGATDGTSHGSSGGQASSRADAESNSSGDRSTEVQNPLRNLFRNVRDFVQNRAQELSEKQRQQQQQPNNPSLSPSSSQGGERPDLKATSTNSLRPDLVITPSSAKNSNLVEPAANADENHSTHITITPPVSPAENSASGEPAASVTALPPGEATPESEIATTTIDGASNGTTVSAIQVNPRPTILGQCRDNTISLPEGAQGYREDWKRFCKDGGSLAEGVCRHSAFSSKSRDSASVRSCERALERLPQLSERIARMTTDIEELRDRMSELSFTITDAELERDEMEADCPDGTCTDARYVSGGTDWARILGIAGVVGLGIYDIHSYTQSAKYRADLNAHYGWPSMAGFGYPAASMGIYGAVLGGLASGTFGCSGGLMGGGLPNMGMYGGGMYGFGMRGMGGGMYGPGMGGGFGMPGMGGGMYGGGGFGMPGMGGGMYGGGFGMPGMVGGMYGPGMGGGFGMPGMGGGMYGGGGFGMPGMGGGIWGGIGGGLYMNPFMTPYMPYTGGMYPPYGDSGGDPDKPGRESR